MSQPEKRKRARPTAVKEVLEPIVESNSISEYEQRRLENIRRNQELLASLQVKEAVRELRTVVEDTKENIQIPVISGDVKPLISVVRILNRKRMAMGVKPAVKKQAPKRASTRLQGLPPPSASTAATASTADGEDEESESTMEGNGMPDELWDGRLIPPDKFFSPDICAKAARVDGHFKGWLNPILIAKHGFESSASEAWDRNGGGKFSFKDPLGTGNVAKGAKPSAKVVAQMLFRKNPNAYFYRHNEPEVEQWTGDWTEEERAIFLEVAAKYGCGDKWGLFASYIPHRVGYQCSNYYRQAILPEGLVFDPNYNFTSNGRAIYIGSHASRRERFE